MSSPIKQIFQQRKSIQGYMRKVNEKVVSNKVKKVYDKNEVNGWIRMGLEKGYINKNSKDIISWVKLLSGKDFDL